MPAIEMLLAVRLATPLKTQPPSRPSSFSRKLLTPQRRFHRLRHCRAVIGHQQPVPIVSLQDDLTGIFFF